MKYLIFLLAPIAFLLGSCDMIFNQVLGDIPRSLRVSVRTMTDVDGGWTGTENDFQLVTAGDGVAADGTAGTVTVTSPQNTYKRSDVVTITATNTGTLAFSHWLFPARTAYVKDLDSTEGNIRYDLAGTGVNVSLRTDSDAAELIGVFANDGNAVFAALTLLNTYVDSTTTNFSYILNPAGNETIYNPHFRIFDDNGEARTEWLRLYNNASTNASVTIPLTDITFNKSISGINSPGVLDNWKVIVIYEDVAGDIFVVK